MIAKVGGLRHFWGSAAQGLFWGVGGEVLRQVCENVWYSKWDAIIWSFPQSYGRIWGDLCLRFCSVVVTAPPTVCDDLVTFLCLN